MVGIRAVNVPLDMENRTRVDDKPEKQMSAFGGGGQKSYACQ